ncbi:MAG: acyl--CoA ligase [candidate division Zixibacteria bacterium]|nr:acyl--CoA ligase [candidate division Zixibacteria bacterium]
MKIHDLLIATAAAFPDRIAATHEDRSMSFRQLDQASSRFADHLHRLHPDPDGRVAILFDNSLEYLIAFFGIFKAGLVAVPLDTSLGADALAAILTDCQASTLLVEGKFRRKTAELLRNNPSIATVIASAVVPTGRPDLQPILLPKLIGDPDDYSRKTLSGPDQSPITSSPLDLSDPTGADCPHELAAMFYTSGSTGSCKGVLLSHRNLVSNTIATVQYLRLTPNDSIIVILPFYYIYGNSLLLTHVACGGRLVIDNRFLYPEVVLDTMEREKVTGFSGVPSHFIILLGNSTFASRRLEHLRYFTQAGGAMAPEVIKKLMAAFGHKQIFIMYGQTEASPRVTYLPPERLADKLGSIGIPVPGVGVDVIDEHGQSVPPGQTGEIVVSGPNVMLGYWNQSEESNDVLRDGRLRTGDLARRDEDGYFWIVGRSKEIIKSGGNRVSAKEIEECLLACESVLEAAVVGVSDDILGEAIRAVVVLKNGVEADQKEILLHCKKHLADFKVPKQILFADALPKNQSGKVNKPLLKTDDFLTRIKPPTS